jgi:Ala-tRNA(Pro) deacylase
MSTDNRVMTLLDEEQLDYDTMRHAEACTARGVATASRVPAREVAKAVLVRAGGGRYLMAVVPASCRLDLEALARASCHRGLTLATEEEVARLFPDCEPGALPPFGNLYDIPTFLDACVCDVPEVYFSAGSRREVVGMPISDYLWAARPMLGRFCLHGEVARANV